MKREMDDNCRYFTSCNFYPNVSSGCLYNGKNARTTRTTTTTIIINPSRTGFPFQKSENLAGNERKNPQRRADPRTCTSLDLLFVYLLRHQSASDELFSRWNRSSLRYTFAACLLLLRCNVATFLQIENIDIRLVPSRWTSGCHADRLKEQEIEEEEKEPTNRPVGAGTSGQWGRRFGGATMEGRGSSLRSRRLTPNSCGATPVNKTPHETATTR